MILVGEASESESHRIMPRTITIDDIYRVRTPASPTVSADGAHVVFVLSQADREDDTNKTTIWYVPSTGDRDPVQLTAGPHDASPTFSPDGSVIAFLQQVDGVSQICTVPVSGGEPTILTHTSELPLGCGSPVWNPRGNQLAFSAPVPPLVPQNFLTQPWVTNRLSFKSDDAGRYGGVPHQIHVYDLATGKLRQLTDGDWQAGPPSYSPNGNEIAFTAQARRSDADITLNFHAYRVSVDGGWDTCRRIGHATFVRGPVTWTADGAAVLAVGQCEPRVGNAQLIMLNIDDGLPDADLTSKQDRNVMPGAVGYPGGAPALASDGNTVVFCLRDRGATHLYSSNLLTGALRGLLTGRQQVVSGLSLSSKAPTAAVTLADAVSFGEVGIIDLTTGNLRRLTSFGKELLQHVQSYPAEEREFTISDGSTIHGWLLRSPETTGPAPLLLDVHGGPHNAWTGSADQTHLYHQELVNLGWNVLMLNPRGSDGYGEEFMRAVVGRWGVADEQDFLQPIDQLIEEGVADPDRLAITGYSYGGFTTCRLTALTDRFASAVAGGLVCDLTSNTGASDIGVELTKLFLQADAIKDRESLLALSPIKDAGSVRTPTLVLHGEDDHRCPVNQGERWFGALRSQQIPTGLVVYPGGTHHVIFDGRPSHRVDYNRRVVKWVQQHPVRHQQGARIRPSEETSPMAGQSNQSREVLSGG